ncbi:hypothetical protein P8452_41487 [Trifolium repens]|nr:hypothetical protein P8452_41487 [Trifolium repens]
MSTSPFYLQLLLLVKKFASFTLIKVDLLPFHVTGSTIPVHEPGSQIRVTKTSIFGLNHPCA